MRTPKETKRADAISGVPVVMADGQTYLIPKPRVRFTDADGDKGYRAVLSLAGGDGYQSLRDAREAALELVAAEDDAINAGEEPEPRPAPGNPLIRAEVAVFKALLLRNYDLTPAEVGEALQISYDPDEDPDGYRIRSELADISEGNGPKPQGGTSA